MSSMRRAQRGTTRRYRRSATPSRQGRLGSLRLRTAVPVSLDAVCPRPSASRAQSPRRPAPGPRCHGTDRPGPSACQPGDRAETPRGDCRRGAAFDPRRGARATNDQLNAKRIEPGSPSHIPLNRGDREATRAAHESCNGNARSRACRARRPSVGPVAAAPGSTRPAAPLPERTLFA
jgi:hypothetical protein